MQTGHLGGKSIDVQSDNTRVRTLVEQDLPALLSWLTDERVLAFYGGRDLRYDASSLRAHYEEPIGETYCRAIIEFRGVPIGYAQIYPLDNEQCAEYGYVRKNKESVFAMDQFIGVPDLWGRGIGTAYLRAALNYLVNEEHADTVLVDPHVDNARAIRAYQKAGFRAAGVLRRHELFEEELLDCLLMVYCPADQAGGRKDESDG